MCENKDRLAIVRKQLNDWIEYAENSGNMNHEKFRKKYESACILSGGNLNSCLIVSTWPLFKKVLSLRKEEFHGLRLNKNPETLRQILEEDFLERTLPDQDNVRKLLELMRLSDTIFNVMILPEEHRELNNAKSYQCKDRMDLFLSKCFEGEAYSSAWENDREFEKWIRREHLEGFFKDGRIRKEHLISFGSLSLEEQLDEYLRILKQRKAIIRNDEKGQ